MEYPFLCSAARSVLQKLKQCKLEDFGDPINIEKDVKILNDVLLYLPFILETRKSSLYEIQSSVFGLHDLLRGPDPHGSKSCWMDLVRQLAEFQGHMQSLSSENKKDLSISYELPEFEGEVVKNWELPPHLVPCLFYCALYPNSERIVRETLVNQWMAEGFLDLPAAGSSSGDTELEDKGNSYFMELFSKGVFINPMFCFGGSNSNRQEAVTIHSCELHPAIHKFALKTASKEVLVDDSKPSYDILNIIYLAVHKNLPMSKIEHLLQARHWQANESFMFTQTHQYRHALHTEAKIRTFMSFDPKWSFTEPISSSCKHILDLSGTQVKSMSSKCQLRYLAFSRNYHLKQIDFDRVYMSQIQTLAVDGCVQLEKVDLKDTTRMRHLYYTSRESELKIHNLSLRILQLSECPDLSSLSLGSSAATFSALRRLRIYRCPSLVSLPNIKDLLTRVEELVFHNCAHLNLNFGRSMDSLPNLQHMELIGLPKLTELPVGLQSASKALKYLMIADCIKLTSTNPVLQNLAVLEKLFVYNCPDLSIDPRLFQSLKALQSLDMTLNLSETTFSARKDLWDFISHIEVVILDGELLNRNADLPRGKDADHGRQIAAQTEPRLARNFPYFILSLKASKEFKSSEGPFKEDIFVEVARALDGKYKLKPNKWRRWVLENRAYLDRQRLLYLFLFPSYYEFEKETLVQSWMEFLQRTSEHIGNKRFDRFLKRGYIFKSRTDFLTGRDMYKIDVNKVKTDFNVLEGRDLYAMLDDDNTGTDDSTSWHHVSIVSRNIDERVFKTLKRHNELKSVLFIPYHGSCLKQIPSWFFTALLHTQVLILSGTHISELPSTVGYMTNLHKLDLSFTLIERLPESICQLQELQTLDLRGCKHLHALPEGMKALVNLCHLHFDVLGQLSSMPEELGCLTNLCTLSAFIVSKEDGCSLGELKGMKKLSGSLCISGLEHATSEDALEAEMEKKSGIKRLHLKWDYSKNYKDDDRECAISVLEELEPCRSLEELQISYYPGSEYPNWMGYSSAFAFRIYSITLLNCDFERLPSLGDMLFLKHLKIFNLNKVTEIDGCRGGIRKLETLEIDGMLRLKSWHKVEDGDFARLSKLTISRCSKLRELPPNFARLPSLKYLELSHCKSLQSLPDECFQSSLDTLKIINCPLLKKEYSDDEDGWKKIKNVQNIWVDMKDMKNKDKDTDSSSEDELTYYDELASSEECDEMPSTSAEMPSESAEMPSASAEMLPESAEIPSTSAEMLSTSAEMP